MPLSLGHVFKYHEELLFVQPMFSPIRFDFEALRFLQKNLNASEPSEHLHAASNMFNMPTSYQWWVWEKRGIHLLVHGDLQQQHPLLELP